MKEQPIYVYDGVCVLCSRAVRYVLKYDHKQPEIRFVDILTEEGRALARVHGVDPENAHSLIYIEDGKGHLLTDAIFAMARRIGGPGRYILLTSWVPRPLRDWVYARINKNRYRWFGRTSDCYVPTEDTRHRFTLLKDTQDSRI